MKKIIYILLGLIVVVTIATTTLLDPMGKQISQQYATELLKTPVKISQFSTDFLAKRINIDFIEVKNPPNFKHKNALALNHFSLKVGDIDEDLIVIDKLAFDGLEFMLAQNDTNVNLSKLIDNLNQTQSKSPDVSSGNSSHVNEKRIKIKHFSVSDISLKVDSKWLKTTLKVPNISIRNFGGNSGARISEIGKEIATEILRNLKKALEKQGIEAGKKEIEASLRRKIEQKLGIEDGLDSIKKQFDTDEIKNKAKDLLQNLGF